MSDQVNGHATSVQTPEQPTAVCQSILTVIVPHLSDGTMRGLELRTAGPLERQPAVAAQILRKLADGLDPTIKRIVKARELPH